MEKERAREAVPRLGEAKGDFEHSAAQGIVFRLVGCKDGRVAKENKVKHIATTNLLRTIPRDVRVA